MRNAAVLPLIIIAAVVIGGLLYLYGGPAFHQGLTNAVTAPAPTLPGAPMKPTVLAQGTNATSVDERVNYRITSQEQLSMLWQTIYNTNITPVPTVDFGKYEVLGIFDGSHSTAGYSIDVSDVKDTKDARVVTIVHTEPGDSCVPGAGATSPFVLIMVDKSFLPISRADQTETSQCE